MKSFASIWPVAASALAGVVIISLHAQAGRGAHIVWLTVALTESTLSLLFRNRHPLGALAGVLGGYVVFDFPATVIAPLAVALFTVVRRLDRRRAIVAMVATAAVLVGTSLLHAARDGSDGQNVSLVR
jgi:hypothetical protein